MLGKAEASGVTVSGLTGTVNQQMTVSPASAQGHVLGKGCEEHDRDTNESDV